MYMLTVRTYEFLDSPRPRHCSLETSNLGISSLVVFGVHFSIGPGHVLVTLQDETACSAGGTTSLTGKTDNREEQAPEGPVLS